MFDITFAIYVLYFFTFDPGLTVTVNFIFYSEGAQYL